MRKTMTRAAAAAMAVALAAQPAAAAAPAAKDTGVLASIGAAFQRVAMRAEGPRTCIDFSALRLAECARDAAHAFAGFRASAGFGYAWGEADATANWLRTRTPEIFERKRANAHAPWGAYAPIYSAETTKAMLNDPAKSAAGATTGELDLSGVIGEIALGYDQDLGDWVIGGAVSFGLTNLDGSEGGVELESDWTASLLARAGYKIDPQTLIFATAGLALQDFEATYQDGKGAAARKNSTELGFVIGAGVERILKGNIFAALEYRYTDFGEIDLAGASSTYVDGQVYDYGTRQRGAMSAASYSATIEPRLHALRASLGLRL